MLKTLSPEPQLDSECGVSGDDVEEEVEVMLDDRPMRVRPGLFIGSMMAEANKARLAAVPITDIVQVAEGLYPHHPFDYAYLNLQVTDTSGEDLVAHFPCCFEFIDQGIRKGGNVLVHCAAGISRSATIVIGYLMARDGLSYEEAAARLRQVRPWVQPNEGFVAQLREYERLGLDMGRWRAWRHVWPAHATGPPLVVVAGAAVGAAAGAAEEAAPASSKAEAGEGGSD